MNNCGKRSILGIRIDAVDYETAVEFVVQASLKSRSAAISALAVHGLMTGVLDREHKYRLNHFDLLVPDGQPVRWALNLLYATGLRDRVCGPELTPRILARAADEGISVFFYGSTPQVLGAMRKNVEELYPRLRIAGMESSKFRQLTPAEKDELTARISESGASIVFVGLGCPRQEVWAYEFRESLSMPIVAVGAAFSFLAGTTARAPRWMQDRGLEWVYRLCKEPRLWRRYLFLNPVYLFLLLLQTLGLSRFATEGQPPPHEMLYG